MEKQRIFERLIGIIMMLMFIWMVIKSDDAISMAALALVASPIGYIVLRAIFEGWSPRLTTASWAFAFGDSIALPALFVFGSIGWSLGVGGFFGGVYWWNWWIFCLVAGLAAGYAFHYLMDGPAYRKAGWAESLDSPTKLWHDFVSYPVLFGGAVYLGVPTLVSHFWWVGFAVLLSALAWGGMAVRDALAAPDPRLLHPRWDTAKFAVITD